MAATFTITELSRTDQGTYVETGSKFSWDARTQSSPRHGWEYGVRLRTVRDDYPGADEPVEQILGPNYEAFSLHGVWDDRWAGAGFAENQRVEMEKLVQRGNFVKIQVDGVSITGLITTFKATYLQSYRTAYELTFSPHFRLQGGDARRGNVQAPRAVDPVKSAGDAIDVTRSTAQLATTSPSPFLATDIASQAATLVSAWATTTDILTAAIATRALSSGSPPSGALAASGASSTSATSSDDDGAASVASLPKIIAAFADLQAQAAELLPLMSTIRTDTALAYEGAVQNLALDFWARETSFNARQMILTCARAQSDLAAFVDPRSLAVYRPTAGESLYSISNRFYNTPHRWRAIAERNGLVTFTLTGAETLIIPDARGA